MITRKMAFSLVALAAASAFNANATTEITVKASNATEVYIATSGRPERIELNAQGVGHYTITKPADGQAMIGLSKEYDTFYYGDGDAITVSFDANDFVNTLKFEGPKADLSTFARKNKPEKISQDDYKLPFDTLVKKVYQLETNFRLAVSKAGLGSKYPKIISDLTSDMHYSNMSDIIYHRDYYMYLNQTSDYPFENNYIAYVKANTKEDMAMLRNRAYTAAMVAGATAIAEAKLKESAGDKQLEYPAIIAGAMEYVCNNFKNRTIKARIINDMATDYVSQSGVDGAEKIISLFHENIDADDNRTAKFDNLVDKWGKLASGKPSPNFIASNIKGETKTLADFAGKYVYVDIWATWCGPCRKEAPFFKQLQPQFKDDNIAFVSISVDQKKEAWEKMVAKETGITLHENKESTFTKEYMANSIPRFILIGPKGEIVDCNMLRPSDPKVVEYLKSLPGLVK